MALANCPRPDGLAKMHLQGYQRLLVAETGSLSLVNEDLGAPMTGGGELQRHVLIT